MAKQIIIFITLILPILNLVAQEPVYVNSKVGFGEGILKNINGQTFLICPSHTFSVSGQPVIESSEGSIIDKNGKVFNLSPNFYSLLDVSFWPVENYPVEPQNNWDFLSDKIDISAIRDIYLKNINSEGVYQTYPIDHRNNFSTDNKELLSVIDQSGLISLGMSGSPVFANFKNNEIFVGTLLKVDPISRKIVVLLQNKINEVFKEFLKESESKTLLRNTINNFYVTRSISIKALENEDGFRLANHALAEKISGEIGCSDSTFFLLPDKINTKSKNFLTFTNCLVANKLQFSVYENYYSKTSSTYNLTYKLYPISPLKAGIYSTLFPGMGQLYKKDFLKGTILPLTIPAAVLIRRSMFSKSLWFFEKSAETERRYNFAVLDPRRPNNLFEIEEYIKYEEMLDSLKSTFTAQKNRGDFILYYSSKLPYIIGGVIWGMNIIDAIIPYRSKTKKQIYLKDFNHKLEKDFSLNKIGFKYYFDRP